MKVTKEQYEFAQNRVEELLPMVSDKLMSDVVIAYEKEHFPIRIVSRI